MRALVLLITIAVSAWAGSPTCNHHGEFIAKEDCSGHYRCVGLTPIEMPDCAENMVFSPTHLTCVTAGSHFDDCQAQQDGEECEEVQYKRKANCSGYSICYRSQTTEMPDCPTGMVFSLSALTCVPETHPNNDCGKVKELCATRGGLIPYPYECQLYYNCSHTYKYVPRLLEQHMMECPYPSYFNVDTQKCDHYNNVHCGGRKAYKNGCDYRRNQCVAAHCIPCDVRMPSCEGLPDGNNAHAYKTWSPYYVICQDERFVTEMTCPRTSDGLVQLFSPVYRACVGLDQIPPEHGGI